jgi:hypothetical protein
MNRRLKGRHRMLAVERVLVEPDRAQFTALRYFVLKGTDHVSHIEQACMIRRYVK